MNLDCNVCDKPARIACGRCHVARYCSKVCQKLDWDHPVDAHRHWCFNVNNPDIEQLKNLIVVCVKRQKEENEEEEEEEQEAPPKPELDVDAAIHWLHVELENPFDLDFGLVGPSVEEEVVKKKIQKQKRKRATGQLEEGYGKIVEARGKGKGGKKGEKLKAKGEAHQEHGEEKQRKARRKLRRLRRKKRKIRKRNK